MVSDKEFRSGHVALIGRPNVGKSTLLNSLVGEKISIVTAKPHTTRHRIQGVLNSAGGQAIFIDTPGFATDKNRVLHRLMSRILRQARDEADLVVLVTEANRPVEVDAELMRELTESGVPSIVVINKMDRLKSRSDLLPRIEALKAYPFLEFVPVCARSGKNLDALEEAILRHLPQGPALYPSDFKTDRSDRFRAAEIIREKLMLALHQEIPYGIAVEIESVTEGEDGRRQIGAVIWIERESQKAIVIGKQGSVLKRVGRDARLDLNELFGERIHLSLWVKVREHWSDSAEELKRLGFDQQ